MNFRNAIKTQFSIQPPQKIILDIHGGIQDILGIIFTYNHIKKSNSKQQIIGITCVNGKNTLQQSIKSALIANIILGSSIPIYKGQNKSLLLRKDFPKSYNQPNYKDIQHKLYNQVQLYEKYKQLIQKQKAVTFIIQSCHKYKQQLGIICFGPTTNLGLAHRLQTCLKQVKMVSLTGGQYMGMGNTVIGNIQANFAYDPLATHILLQQKSGQGLKNKVYINVFQKSCDFNFKNVIQKCLSSSNQNINKHIKTILEQMLKHNINGTINCAPILTIVPLLQKKSVKNKYYIYAQIVRDNGQVDGLLAINWLKVGAKPGQFQNFLYLYEDYEQEIVQKLVFDALTTNKQETYNGL